MPANAAATEAADADAEAAGIVNTSVDAETAEVVTVIGEGKLTDER